MNDFFHGRDHHRAKEQTPLCKTDNVLKQKTEGVSIKLINVFFIQYSGTRRNYRILFQCEYLIAADKPEAAKISFFLLFIINLGISLFQILSDKKLSITPQVSAPSIYIKKRHNSQYARRVLITNNGNIPAAYALVWAEKRGETTYNF